MAENVDRPQPVRTRWLIWLPWAVALAGLLYLAGLTAWLGFAGLLFPYQLDYGEGIMLHFVDQWSQGQPIYIPIAEYPFATSNYAPLTLLLALALTPILGVHYAAGRIWTLLAVAASTLLVGAWVRREGGRWLPALAAALIFAGSPYIYHWAPLFRVDLIGLALTLAGLYVVQSLPTPRREESPRRLWLAVVLFVAALYAKQSFFFAPGAALLYLLLVGEWRQALKLLAGIGLLGGGIFLAANLLTGWGFWQGLVSSNVNPFLWPEFGRQVTAFARTFGVLGLLAAWYLVDKFVLQRRRAPTGDRRPVTLSPLDLYLPAALLSIALAGKAGAWENYFFEALAALTLCAGLGLARLARYGPWAYRLLAPALILVQIALMWHTPQVAQRYLQQTRESNRQIAPYLERLPDALISEDMGLLVTNDKTMDYYSFQYSQLARAGRWDQAWELDQLRNRRLAAVILETGTRLDVDRYQRFTRDFLSELDHNYGHTATLGKYELYEPDPVQHEQRIEFGDQLALAGWSLGAPLAPQPGDTLNLTVVWQAQQPLDVDYTAFAHLVDEDGQGWAGDDHAPYDGLYPTSAWGGGEMVRDAFTLAVPAGAPPGLYSLQVGWYHPQTQERLPAGDADSARVAVLPIGWQPAGERDLSPAGIEFGEIIRLEGYTWDVTPGAIEVILRWAATGYPGTDYSVFVHLVPAQDPTQVLAQGDAPPLDGRWPTSLWRPGVQLDDTHTIPLPAGLAPGTYQLWAGLYDPLTGVRLPQAGGSDAILLAQVELP